MRRFFLFLIPLLLIIAALFVWQPKKHKKEPLLPITEDKSFVIVIPSYNNSKYIEKNLQSVFCQNYENYRVIYINDNSRDDTLEKAKTLLTKFDKNNRATLIHNPKNLGALTNIYNAVHSCHDHEIVILLDGDDYLAHENVLNTLNQAYADSNIWLTYGNYLDYPSFKQDPQICKKLPEKVTKTRSFRKTAWATTHLRTFYAGLFKEIKLEDLFYRGRPYSMGWDLAIMLPMLEMGSNHIGYIDDVLYLYNRDNPISDHKVNIAFQRRCSEHICSKSVYPELSNLPTHISCEKQTADLLIFSNNNPLQLYSLLESLEKYVTGLNKTTVLYKSSSTEMESGYLELKLDFPNIQFIKQKGDFKTLLTKIVFEPSLPKSQHILFARDTLIVKDLVNLSKEIQSLENTSAYGLYLSLHEKLEFCSDLERHQQIPPNSPLTAVGTDVPLAWQFSAGTDDWNTPNSLNFSLYRKSDLEPLFNRLSYDCLDALVYEWGHNIDLEKIGLFHRKAKSISLRSREPKEKLFEEFSTGSKIDITPLFQVSCPSQEAITNFSFSSRN